MLNGGASNDTLNGGSGSDTMNGGTGSDDFIYQSVADSAPTSFDQITGFALTGDVIDLSQIDANASSVGIDDSFVFIGIAAFAGTGPQVRFSEDTLAGTTTIEVRLAGSVVDDMEIHLNSALLLTVANFDL